MNKNNSKQSGVALLMSLGILALLSILGVTFSTNMRLMERTTRDFIYGMQARYLAEGGVEYAVASLKADARSCFIFNKVASNDEISLPAGGIPTNTTVNVKIIDTARQVNINYADKNLLDTVINGVGQTKAQDIIDRRNGADRKPGIANYDDDKDGTIDEADELGASGSDDMPFITPKSINTVPGIGDVFTGNEDFITVWGYCDPNTQDSTGNNTPRAAININTASQNVLEKVLESIYGVSSGDASTLASQIISKISGSDPFNSWQEFNIFVDGNKDSEGQDYLDSTVKQNIKDNFNPNRKKPQWDSNKSSTEFCFNSGGTYELTSIGTVTKGSGGTGQIVAQKTINTIVKIFDLWNQTTKEQFVISGSESYKWVTWEDNCPVRPDDNWNCGTPKEEDEYDDTKHSTNYLIIKNALKIGYWDEFNENKGNIWWNKQANPTQFNGVADMPQYGEIILGQNKVNWQFSNCSETIKAIESGDPPTWGHYSPTWGYNNAYETGWFMFRYTPNGEDICTQIYYAKEYDAQNNWIRDLDVPFCPFIYTINPDDKLKWVPEQEQAGFQFHKVKTYRAIQDGNFVELYMISDDNTTQFGVPNIGDPKISGTFNRSLSAGWIKLWTRTWVLNDPEGEGGTHWDNLRVITDIGEYTSNPLTLSNPVEWGTVWGTVTKPDSVKNITDVDIKIEAPPGGTEMEFSNGAPITAQKSTSIQYKANLYSKYDATNNPYLETPVLEDVWITYLPKTKILYWRE